ncbi:MAG: tRNA (N(6)-L-threonylcarbamoyladenosine(37)-C(2))-methylthiotransferase MtaB [Spirochaetes bacterium]|nr:tRNA (N(6)-L-threonylcarbamoyladenosine(37)-C(2))-methylthiotransferase MtaB [Spirochaetota bacterium]
MSSEIKLRGNLRLKAAFLTLGCKLNQFESEAIADSFSSLGAEIVSLEFPSDDAEPEAPGAERDVRVADIYIVNTCTVTSKSEQKARRIIRKIARSFPGAAVIVTGCYAQLERDEISKLADNLAVVPQDRKELLLKLPDSIFDKNFVSADFINYLKEAVADESSASSSAENSFYTIKSEYTFHSRAFLKIQDGCDNFCAYCRVPFARGKSRSLEHISVISNIKSLEAAGYREVVLTGVNISAYQSGKLDLVTLTEEILGATEKIRVRFSSIEPDNISKRYLNIIGSERVCGHFHLPVQSGADSVLEAMGRRYSRARVIEAVEILRSGAKNPLICADVITGFPGETEKDFMETISLAEQLALAYLHVFPFSKRPGTAASKMKNVVPERVSRERAEALRKLSDELFAKYALGWEGQVVEALLEGAGDKAGEMWKALSSNYLKLIVGGAPAGAELKGLIARCLVKNHRAGEGNCFDAEFISLV